MNLLHLKYAVEVERTRSITKAAETLFMGQPNLSRAIRELERECGITLFRRTSKGIVPTKQGEEFLHHARQVLEQVQQLEALYGSGADQRDFSVCIPRSACCTHAFARFAAGTPAQGPALSVREAPAKQAAALVVEGTCGIAVIRINAAEAEAWTQRLDKLGLKSEILWQAPLVVVLPHNSPLADETAVDSGQLTGLTEIAYGDEEFPPAGPSNRITVHEQSSRFDLLAALPESYLWDSPTPAAVLKRLHLVQKRCVQAPYSFCDLLVYKKFFRIGKEDARFLSVLKRAQTQAAQALKRL